MKIKRKNRGSIFVCRDILNSNSPVTLLLISLITHWRLHFRLFHSHPVDMRITVGLSCPDTVITSLRSLGHRSIHPISPTTQLLIATSVQDRAYRVYCRLTQIIDSVCTECNLVGNSSYSSGRSHRGDLGGYGKI